MAVCFLHPTDNKTLWQQCWGGEVTLILCPSFGSNPKPKHTMNCWATWVLWVGWAPVDVRLLGGDGGSAAVRAGGRHHGRRGGGGRVVTGDLAGDCAKLGHWDGTQARPLGDRGRGCCHCTDTATQSRLVDEASKISLILHSKNNELIASTFCKTLDVIFIVVSAHV